MSVTEWQADIREAGRFHNMQGIVGLGKELGLLLIVTELESFRQGNKQPDLFLNHWLGQEEKTENQDTMLPETRIVIRETKAHTVIPLLNWTDQDGCWLGKVNQFYFKTTRAQNVPEQTSATLFQIGQVIK